MRGSGDEGSGMTKRRRGVMVRALHERTYYLSDLRIDGRNNLQRSRVLDNVSIRSSGTCIVVTLSVCAAYA